MGSKPDDKVRHIVGVMAGTEMRPGEVLGPRPVDIFRREQRHGRPRAWHRDPVLDLAAVMIRRRLSEMTPDQSVRTISANRSG